MALPGGHLEFGETLAACRSREFFEECGLNVEAEKLVYVHENFYTVTKIATHEIGFYFLVDLNSEFPTPDSEGYIPSREAHIRVRLLPLAAFRSSSVMPSFSQSNRPRIPPTGLPLRRHKVCRGREYRRHFHPAIASWRT